MNNCAFCNIKEKANVIIETEHCYVIPDEHPVAKGHLLVITKKHYKSIIEIPDSELCDIIKTIKETEKRMLEKLKVEGIEIIQNYKPFVKESRLKKEHVHFHLIPRSFNDQIYQKKGKLDRTKLSEEEKQELANKLK